MKAGLITFYQMDQAGTLLSAAALEHAVEALGTDCEIINYHPGEQSAQSGHGRQSREKPGAAAVGLRVSGHCFASLEELQSAELPYDVLLASGPV